MRTSFVFFLILNLFVNTLSAQEFSAQDLECTQK